MNRRELLAVVVFLALCVPAATLHGGIMPGLWKSADGDVEFYVTSDGKKVEKFSVFIHVPKCGDYKITLTGPVDIIDGSFSFPGSYYASGTFGSDSSASGKYGFIEYEIADCGKVNSEPEDWNAICDGCSPDPTPTPQAQVNLNGTSFAAGSPFTATFLLGQAVTSVFNAYAVVNLPDGSMLDAVSLGPNIKSLATNVPGLPADFSYPLMSLAIPAGAPKGNCSVMVGFFAPNTAIHGPGDAFLLATTPFTLE